MRVALLSDAHLRGPDDPNQGRLVRFLSTLEVDRLAVLGDLFQHWWHFPAPGRAVPFRQYAPVIDALRRHRLLFVPGNHDFHAARWLREELGAEVGFTLSPSWDGLRVHLSHGDEADGSVGYAAVSAMLRGRPFAAIVDALGPERGWRFLARIAGNPAGVPSEDLRVRQRTLATELHGQGRALVVMGHTHAPEITALEHGTFVNLGDWVRWHTWCLVEDATPRLLRRLDDGSDVPFASVAQPATTPPA